ncbi:MAG: glycine cleavage system protein GcvH [bacterium]|nr:glycine cleavage system protein GcvH [bacterium]
MNFDNMRFTKNHEWVAFENGSDVVTVGITDFAAGELGDIVFVELPEIGTTVESMQAIGTIEAVKTVADLYSPVSGVVKEVNGSLEENPDVVNKSPFKDGWFLKIDLEDRAQLDDLMAKSDYDTLVGR